MELDILRDLQDRGRFFWKIFPGAKASDEHRQRGQIERNEEKAAGGRSAPADDRHEESDETENDRRDGHGRILWGPAS
jgi:hypothetical protein